MSWSCSTSPTTWPRRASPADRDRVERAGDEFHARVRAAYRDLAPTRGWVVVDGTGTPDEVGHECAAQSFSNIARMFAGVVGQDRAVETFERAAARPVHAYLLVGPRGSGVEDTARAFAALLIGAPTTSARAGSCSAACIPMSSSSSRPRPRTA